LQILVIMKNTYLFVFLLSWSLVALSPSALAGGPETGNPPSSPQKDESFFSSMMNLFSDAPAAVTMDPPTTDQSEAESDRVEKEVASTSNTESVASENKSQSGSANSSSNTVDELMEHNLRNGSWF
jgi:hypothetical protein